MTIRIAPEAMEDFEACLRHIARNNRSAALQVATNVDRVIRELAAGDYDGPEQVLRDGAIVRSWPAAPLRIYYQRDKGVLHVLRMYHYARRPLGTP